MKRHTNHSILLQAMTRHGVRWEPFMAPWTKGELCFNGLRWSTEIDHLGCPIIPQSLLHKLIPLIEGFKDQPKA